MNEEQRQKSQVHYTEELECLNPQDFKRLGGDSSKGEGEGEELRQATMLEF